MITKEMIEEYKKEQKKEMDYISAWIEKEDLEALDKICEKHELKRSEILRIIIKNTIKGDL